MDEQRKALVVGGIYVGDITLALAGLATELPAYVKDLDGESLVGDGGEAEAIRGEVDKMLAESPETKSLPPHLMKMVLERAISRGKFLSATRCLEIMGEQDAYVEKYLALAQTRVGEGKFKEAAEAFVIASNLELNEGTPLFQYTGPALHDACTASREKCITRLPAEAAVLTGLQYLLEGTKTCEAVTNLVPEVRRNLLPHVGLARDPNAATFYRDYKRAHADLVDIEKGALSALRDDLKRVTGEIARFAESPGGATPGAGAKEVVEKILRTANSLKKEFSEAESLLDGLQLRRLRRRLEQLLEARTELEDAQGILKKGTGPVSSIERMLDLINGLTEKKILEATDTTEESILATQVTMLGRRVHSQEHWQYLRELAFKYPISPLMCCVRPINAKWMVVHAWNSEIAGILRDFLEKQVAGGAS